MKTYTIDCLKWVSGDGLNRIGEGATKMLNSEGHMCCLGHCALQDGADPAQMLDMNMPAVVGNFESDLMIRQSNGNGIFNGILFPCTRLCARGFIYEFF